MTLRTGPLEDALELCKVHGCHLGRLGAWSCFISGRLGLGVWDFIRVQGNPWAYGSGNAFKVSSRV